MNNRNGQDTTLTPRQHVRLEELVDKMKLYRADLLYRGAIQRRFNRSPSETFVLQFRQKATGSRDGRQKRIYIGTDTLIVAEVERILWQWRRRAGSRMIPVRFQPGRDVEAERKMSEAWVLTLAPDELSDVLRMYAHAIRRIDCDDTDA